jgi:hypothetical protein
MIPLTSYFKPTQRLQQPKFAAIFSGPSDQLQGQPIEAEHYTLIADRDFRRNQAVVLTGRHDNQATFDKIVPLFFTNSKKLWIERQSIDRKLAKSSGKVQLLDPTQRYTRQEQILDREKSEYPERWLARINQSWRMLPLPSIPARKLDLESETLPSNVSAFKRK